MAGWKVWAPSEVVSASNLNGYVQEQCVIALPSASSLSSLTAHEGMTVYLQDENRYYVYNGTWIRTELASATSGRTGAFITRNADQNVTNNSPVSIQWNNENTDSDGFITVPNTTAVIPNSPNLGGVYAITVRAVWATNPVIQGAAYIELSAGNETFRTTYAFVPSNQGYTNTGLVKMSPPPAILALQGGDQIFVQVLQASGATLVLSAAKLWFYRISV